MNQKHFIFSMLLVGVMSMSGCGPAEQPAASLTPVVSTAAPIPTNTLLSTYTALPTNTPQPTSTPLPTLTPHLPLGGGVNLSGADFGTNGTNNLPGTYGTDYMYPDNQDVDYFMSKGMRIFRLPFMWERLQQTPLSKFDTDEQAHMDKFVNYATGKGAYEILDPANYARYYGKIIGSSAVPVADFADFWSKLAGHYGSNNKVIFDLMNEPNTMSTDLWVSDANAAIQAIRLIGATNLILVEGNSWSNAESWGRDAYGTPNAIALLGIHDAVNNVAYEVHQYLDSTSSGSSATCVSSTIGSQRLAYFTNWLRLYKKRGFLGEFGVSMNDTCLAALDDMLTYVDQNSTVYLGWTYFAAGQLKAGYLLSIEPISGMDRPQLSPLLRHLP